ncbi:MAG: type II secretion system protein [Luteolibacter sp.]
MKLTTSHTPKRKSGMTILELTVVILVLLALISILFVGATAWKKGADRAANLMNIRNCQQAMRGAQNTALDPTLTAFTGTDLLAYMKMPTTIGGTTALGMSYTAGTVYTAKGVLWLTVAYGTDYPSATNAPPAALYSEW